MPVLTMVLTWMSLMVTLSSVIGYHIDSRRCRNGSLAEAHSSQRVREDDSSEEDTKYEDDVGRGGNGVPCRGKNDVFLFVLARRGRPHLTICTHMCQQQQRAVDQRRNIATNANHFSSYSHTAAFYSGIASKHADAGFRSSAVRIKPWTDRSCLDDEVLLQPCC